MWRDHQHINVKYTKYMQTYSAYLESFFDTEVDLTGNPNTNIWNIRQHSNTCTCDFTDHICRK